MALEICPRCITELQRGQCPDCGEFFIPSCSQCGNMLVFEEVDYNGINLLRCGVCSNETDFELKSLGSQWGLS
ncbi:MAG: hypothetical protein GX341_06105 [Firmicutes bacterium]|jgi:predicted amidophosphoribosyltransferase|nr:hypothetical protein [Bacillota bacterium]